MKMELMEKFNKVKVSNLCSPRSGEPVKNQFNIKTSEGIFYQSYNTLICGIIDNKLVVNQSALFSKTTRKYLSVWLDLYFSFNQANKLYRQIVNANVTEIELEVVA